MSLKINVFQAYFESDFNYATGESGPGKIILNYGRYRVAEFPLGIVIHMDEESVDEFIAAKFGELFTLLRTATTSDEVEV